MITLQQLQGICQTSKGRQAVGQYLDALNRHMPAYGITSKASIAAFLAQIAHESQDFTRVVENLNYGAEGLASTWPSRYAVDPKAKVKAPNSLALRLHRKPEAIANNVYANRMGNGPEASGDGWRHRGAGLKQLTGKNNQKAFGESIGMPIENVPAYLQTPDGAARSACWFWQVNKLSYHAERGDFTGLTEAINGGTIGLESRKSYWAEAKRIIV